jgi:hypothetical protein
MSNLCSSWRSVVQYVLVSSTHLGLATRFLLLSDSCELVDVGRSLWRENGSAVYNFCWSSPAQSFLFPSQAELMTEFYCLTNMGVVKLSAQSSHTSKPHVTKRNKKFWEELCACFPLILHGPQRQRIHQLFCCYVCICFRGNVFTAMFPSNRAFV